MMSEQNDFDSSGIKTIRTHFTDKSSSTVPAMILDLLNQNWIINDTDEHESQLIQNLYSICPAIARLLVTRGFVTSNETLESFLHPLMGHFLSPNMLLDIDRAVERIALAISQKEHITIFGDYDTDGITSTALLKMTFAFVGYPIEYYIPHRLDEGYGMNVGAIKQLAQTGTDLLITVDTGISAHKEIETAKLLGMDVIVTDHHIPSTDHEGREWLPQAFAIVDPKRKDCPYPNKHLAGVGVAFKLAHALLKHLDIPQDKALPFLKSMLSLVALGTIADIAPMIGENRSIVHYGLEQISACALPGIVGLKRALFPEGKKTTITTRKIGFVIAPRLNAAGRTDHAGICVELLAAQDADVAFHLTQKLEEYNSARRLMEDDFFLQAVKWIEANLDLEKEQVIVVAGENWHLGVIGIVASRLVERYQRPSIVISVNGDIGKGSARSIRNFDIHSALSEFSQQFESFGGHSFAAGFQMPNGEIEHLRHGLNRIARQQLNTHKYDSTAIISVDTCVTPQDLRNENFLTDLVKLEPHGPENPQPVFLIKNAYLFPNSIKQIKTTQHLKFKFLCNKYEFVAVFFNQLALIHFLEEFANNKVAVDIVFTATVNDYFVIPRLDIDVRGIRPTQHS